MSGRPAALQAYLLAAGNGRRAGGPKAWREFEGKTLLQKQVEFLLQSFRPENIAVSIQEGWEKRCREISSDVRWVPVNPEASPLASLQALLAAAPMRGWAFFYHVDMPVWESELFQALSQRIAAAESAGAEALAPAYQGRKGHPLLLSPKIGPLIAALNPATNRLDHWLRERKENAVELPFSCVLENWNSAIAGEAR